MQLAAPALGYVWIPRIGHSTLRYVKDIYSLDFCSKPEGSSMKHKRKLTGVNCLIMVCTVPDVKETWKNTELLFSLSKLNNIPYKFVSDYKLLLVCLGL